MGKLSEKQVARIYDLEDAVEYIGNAYTDIENLAAVLFRHSGLEGSKTSVKLAVAHLMRAQEEIRGHVAMLKNLGAAETDPPSNAKFQKLIEYVEREWK